MKRKRNCGNCCPRKGDAASVSSLCEQRSRCPICGHRLYLVGTESGMKRLCKSCGYREK